MSVFSNPMANHNHQPPDCPYCEPTDAWICNRCGTHYDGMQGQCVHCPPEPTFTFTLAQVKEMKNAWVDEAMGRVTALGEVDSTARLIVNDAIFYPLKLVARAIKEMKE